MKWIKPWLIFESKNIRDFIDLYLNTDLEDERLIIRSSDVSSFLGHKYKNSRKTYLKIEKQERDKLKKLEASDKLKVFSIYGSFNLYDVEPSIKRLIDYAKSIGYNNFEIRKMTQMSRRSVDVTSSFTGRGRLPESANRGIVAIDILIMKDENEIY